MSKIKSLSTYAAAAALAAAGTGLGLYSSRLRTIASIKKVSDTAGPYNLYSMDVKYAYDLDRLINRGLGGNQDNVDAILSEALPLLPAHMHAPDFGCSAFALSCKDGAVMGRNYDFKFNTSAMLVHCAPKDRYESIAFCALDNIGANEPFAKMKKRFACLAAPFICLDGVNEKGVSIAVLTLDSIPVCQNTGKQVISTSIAIRLVLDRAASTQEAVDLLLGYDMFATSGRDYHFYITDAAGDGRVLEYDCDSDDRKAIITPVRQITNFFIAHKDKVKPNCKNGRYGHGRERCDAMERIFDEAGINKNGSSDSIASDTLTGDKLHTLAWRALKAAAQKPDPKEMTSNTQWSIVFDNRECTADIALHRRWDEAYHAALNGKIS